MCIELENVGGQGDCDEPIAGMDATLYIAKVSDFDTLQELPELDVDGTMASKATITGNHVFKAGKGFTKINGVEETGGIKSTPMGDTGRKMFQNESVTEVAGSDATLLGFMRLSKNGKYIVLHQEAGSGRVRQLGSSRLPARINAEHAIEPAVEGKNAATLTITDKSFCPAPIYTGDIVLAPGASE